MNPAISAGIIRTRFKDFETTTGEQMGIMMAAMAGIAGCALSLLMIPWLRKQPWAGNRSATAQYHQTHKQPVSRLGGLALAVPFFLVAGIALAFFSADRPAMLLSGVVCMTSLAMFGLGFLDDLKPLGAKRKLLGQVLIAGAAYAGGIQIGSFTVPGFNVLVELGWWGLPVTVLWLVALTNLINLIDGVDGLAGGVALMVMLLLAYVGLGASQTFPMLCAAGVSGALIGFLRYNFPPARIYMGDGGAYFLGYLIACLSVMNSHKGTVAAALIAPLIALALPIIDVTLAIVRRGLKGLPLFRADRKHIHHRLQSGGFSRRRTVLSLYAFSLLFLILAFLMFLSQGRSLPLVFGISCVVLLIAAHSVDFSREWFAVGRVLGNSMEVRNEARYALVLSRWLELEAGRSPSVQALWKDFLFAAEKLGFCHVRLILQKGELSWRAPGEMPLIEVMGAREEIHLGDARALEFQALSSSGMSEKKFELISELAAEMWVKAALRWHALNEEPIRFAVSAAPERAQDKSMDTAAGGLVESSSALV